MANEIVYINKPTSKEELLSLFDPIVKDWFNSKYSTLTEPQAYAVKYIHSGKNVLISAPTGSGKTLTGFLTIINELFLLAKQEKLEDQVYCVYISPLKALANDIHRNLEVPLNEIYELGKKENINLPKITVGVRSGDTPTSERQKMLKKPPNIFITTPESLGMVLSSIKFREKFRNVRYVIVDEIHELSSSKRGVMLSLNLERLAEYAGEFVRIGLSATQSPIEEMAKYLVGYRDGQLRKVYISEVETRKSLDLKVITPVPDLNAVPYEIANEKMYDILEDIIKAHKTTLIFTNTRSGSEHVAIKLKQRGIDSLEVHHSSLGKITRINVEESLKQGKLKCVITSTSLELGIDIGYIDIVVQIGSPKSISKGLQRVGRSGHAYGSVAKGRFVVFDNDDLIECAVLVKQAYDNKLDRIFTPKNSLDVLSQVIVGMSLENVWDLENAYTLIKRSYCYSNLDRKDFMNVINYLSGKTYGEPFYSKIWYDEEQNKFGKKRSTRMIYFMNMGTIPEEADYTVLDERNVPLGMLSEKFVERLKSGDIFVLGAKSYEFQKTRGSKVYVKNAAGKKPTVPSWSGEMLPRSYDLSIEVGKFRGELSEMLKNGENPVQYLIDTAHVDEYGAKSIITYIKEQMLETVPTDKRLLIEGYIDTSKKSNIIFHYPFGRRVNDALSRAYAYAISGKYGTNVRLSITDDAFMITASKKIDLSDIPALVKSKYLDEILKSALNSTELYKQRFRHCAARAFMVLRRYKSASISVARQQLRSDKILDILKEIKDFPIVDETYNEIFNIAMDLPHAKEVLEGIESREINIVLKPYSENTSIFSNSIILASISDIVLMEDRNALLKEIHMKVLERVLPKEQLYATFDPDQVTNYFNSKFKSIETEEDILSFLKLVGASELFLQRGTNIYSHSTLKYETLRNMAINLLKKEKVTTIYTTQITWTINEYLPYYLALYQHDSKSEYSELLRVLDHKKSKDAIKELNMRKDLFFDQLKDLERSNLIYRLGIEEGDILWGVRTENKADYRESLRFLVTKLLGSYGPLTKDELLFKIGFTPDQFDALLEQLLQENYIKYGRFLVGYENQYMLTEDYENIKNIKNLDFEAIKRYRFYKMTKKVDSISDYFDKYLFAYSSYSVFLRLDNIEDWKMLRINNRVMYAKFLKNRLCYTTADLAGLFNLRPYNVNSAESRILQAINSLDNANAQTISRYLNEDPGIVRRELTVLDENLKVGRKFEEFEENSKNLNYVSLGIEDYGTLSDLLYNIITRLGPLNVYDLESITGLEKYELQQIVDNLTVESLELDKVKYYYSKQESIVDKNVPETVLMDLHDPYLLPYYSEIFSDYGYDFNYFMVNDGKIIAALKINDRGSYSEIEDMIVSEKKEFDEGLKVLSKYLKFKSQDLLLLTKQIDPENMNSLISFGFKKLNDLYYYGTVYEKKFELKDLYSYIFFRQGLGGYKRSVNEIEAMNLGIRSDLESIARCNTVSTGEKYLKSRIFYLGYTIPDTIAYCSRETLELLKNVKSGKLTKQKTVVLNLIKRKPYYTESNILEESPLGAETTKTILEELFKDNYIAKSDKNTYIVVEKDRDPYFSQYLLIKKLFEAFGALNVQKIKVLVGKLVSTSMIFEFLKTLEREGMVIKIFVDNDLYWILKEDFKLMGTVDIKGSFILAPQDILYRFLSEDLKQKKIKNAYLIYDNSVLAGYFKASKKKNEIKITSFDAAVKYRNIVKSALNKAGLRVT